MARSYQGSMAVDLSISFCSLHCGSTKAATQSHGMELLGEMAIVFVHIPDPSRHSVGPGQVTLGWTVGVFGEVWARTG